MTRGPDVTSSPPDTVLCDLGAHLSGGAAPLALGTLVAATTVIGFRHHALPRWLASSSAILAVAMIVPLAPWVAIGFFPLWVLALSILLYRRQADADQPTLPLVPASILDT
jgi:hypothetical protein